MEEGALRDAIGRTGPMSDPGTVTAHVGVGVGREATRRVDEWKKKGINVFEYAKLLEEGGFAGRDGSVRIAPRPYVRTSIEELRVEIFLDWEQAL